MTDVQTRNKEIIRRFNKEFIEGGDDALFDETVAPDFRNHSAHDPRNPGPEGAKFFFTQVLRPAFPDLKVDIEDQFAEGDVVVTRKSYDATHQGMFMGVPATGKRVRFGVIDIIRLRDGKYTEHWANADMMGLMQQLKGA